MLSMLYGGSLPQIPVWDFSDRVLGAFNDAQGSEDFVSFSGLDLSQGKNLGLPGAAFELKIVDEDSKINANVRASEFSKVRLVAQLSSLLYGPQYDPLFERKDGDGNYSDRQSICSALIDWSDPDQETQLCDPSARPRSRCRRKTRTTSFWTRRTRARTHRSTAWTSSGACAASARTSGLPSSIRIRTSPRSA